MVSISSFISQVTVIPLTLMEVKYIQFSFPRQFFLGSLFTLTLLASILPVV